MKISKEQIKVAVQWWSKVIQNAKFDNGADSESASMASLMGKTLALKNSPTKKQIQEFQYHLILQLEKANFHTPYLGVDYDPCEDLYQPAQKAGIDMSVFPWKTSMFFRDGGVQVRYGYGADFKELLLKNK